MSAATIAENDYPLFTCIPAGADIISTCIDRKIVMVYGALEYGYLDLQDFFRNENVTVINCKSYDSADFKWLNTPPSKDLDHQTGRQCKDVLIYHIFENWKRSLKNEPLVPLLFCIGSPGIRFDASAFLFDEKNECLFEGDSTPPLITSAHMTSKKPEENQRISRKELRRLYKLCEDPQVDPEIREIANRSAIFLNIDISHSTKEIRTIERVQAPWANPSWHVDYSRRKQQTGLSDKIAQKSDWRTMLARAVQAHRPQESSPPPQKKRKLSAP